MTKLEFLLSLHKKLDHLPQRDVEERLNFYCEMIEDRVEEGLSEEDAVSAVGSIEDIAKQIQNDLQNSSTNNAPIKTKCKRNAWEVVLLILGAPIWFSLLIAAFAVAVSLYASLWSVVVCMWAIFISLIACSLGAIICAVGFFINGNFTSGITLIALALICAGLSILTFFLCKIITSFAIKILKKILSIRKKHLSDKEEAL